MDVFTKSLRKLTQFQRYVAFTLSEVLITIGIVGIVAEMTVPALYATTAQLIYISAWKKAYSNVNQAMLMIQQENGSPVESPTTMAEAYTLFSQIQNKLSVNINCGNNDDQKSCYLTPTSGLNYKGLNNSLMTECPTTTSKMFGAGQIKLKDGSYLMMGNGYGPTFIWIDVNGPNNGPNVAGKDFLGMQLVNGKMLPLGASNTAIPTSTCDNSSFDLYGYLNCAGCGCSAKYLQN